MIANAAGLTYSKRGSGQQREAKDESSAFSASSRKRLSLARSVSSAVCRSVTSCTTPRTRNGSPTSSYSGSAHAWTHASCRRDSTSGIRSRTAGARAAPDHRGLDPFGVVGMHEREEQFDGRSACRLRVRARGSSPASKSSTTRRRDGESRCWSGSAARPSREMPPHRPTPLDHPTSRRHRMPTHRRARSTASTPNTWPEASLEARQRRGNTEPGSIAANPNGVDVVDVSADLDRALMTPHLRTALGRNDQLNRLTDCLFCREPVLTLRGRAPRQERPVRAHAEDRATDRRDERLIQLRDARYDELGRARRRATGPVSGVHAATLRESMRGPRARDHRLGRIGKATLLPGHVSKGCPALLRQCSGPP